MTTAAVLNLGMHVCHSERRAGLTDFFPGCSQVQRSNSGRDETSGPVVTAIWSREGDGGGMSERQQMARQ